MFFDNTLLDIAARGFILSAIGLAWVTLLIRIVGLRSLSKMTNFDFVMTVALGSVLAAAVTADKWTVFGQCIAAMAGLFLFQWLVARARKDSDTFETAIQNEPIFLMREGEFCEDALKSTRVARSDVMAKLREANVLSLSEVRAVVLETTGDVSVLHGEKLDDSLVENVRD
ncbi:DUF421 domain-containing protein [Qipengyuania sp. 1NDH17]|uniref:DUF421 domain-containing protein n=1 Tax=Qipengyuania polymorpha TaxID=2867234 RepID=A0ABS7J4D9_9SPHN|nr:YetF domain-containing protein [Qipengyuania polymorpha]MBX7458303.1 DUF421 domain-containing protein [Qipengyuania polymorpha]